MITFDAEVKVLEKAKQSVPRKDGKGTFDFTEVKLETTDKKPTLLIARLADKDMDVDIEETYKMRFCINSFTTSTGKVFNNFVVLAFQTIGIPNEEPVEPFEYDDLPF